MNDTIDRDDQSIPTSAVTAIPISPRTHTLLLTAAFVAVVLLFVWLPSVLPVLLGGATLALVLSWPVRLLARVLPRGLAIFIVVVGLLLLVVVTLVAVIPVVVRELTDLIVASPQLVSDAERGLRRLLQPLAEHGLLTAEPEDVIANIEQGLITRAQTLAQATLVGVFGLLTDAFGMFLQLFGVLFIAIYLLADIRRFEAAYLWAVPARYRRDARALWNELGWSLSRYLGGLLISLAIQGMLALILMSLLGVPYAFLLGLWTAATGILPYIGAWLGAIPAVILALLISPLTALLAALAYLAINQIEGNILTPRIQGEAVKVHPLLVFLAVFAGGEIGGLLGAAFAVPVLAVLRVLIAFFAVRLRVQQPPSGAAAGEPAAGLLARAAPAPAEANTAVEQGECRDGPDKIQQVEGRRDTAQAGYVANLEQMALENACFRRVLFTGRHYQLALMTLRPGEETGLERHDEGDQFVRVAAGEGEVVLNGERTPLREGTAVVVPSGVEHNFVNISASEPLRLSSFSAPTAARGRRQ